MHVNNCLLLSLLSIITLVALFSSGLFAQNGGPSIFIDQPDENSTVIIFEPGLLPQDDSFSLKQPYIFVDHPDEIPDSRREREAYFYVLLDYEKYLVQGFLGFLELYYGNILSPGHQQRVNETEVIKTDFLNQTDTIETSGISILQFRNFSNRELFYYQNMIRRSFETFNQLFQ